MGMDLEFVFVQEFVFVLTRLLQFMFQRIIYFGFVREQNNGFYTHHMIDGKLIHTCARCC